MKPLEIANCPLAYVENSVARQIRVNDVVDERNGKCHFFTTNPAGMGLRQEIAPAYLALEGEGEAAKRQCYRLSRHFRRVGVIASSPDIAEMISAVRKAITGTALHLLSHGSALDVKISLPLAVDHIKVKLQVGGLGEEETQDE